METQLVKQTKREAELIQSATKAMDSHDYEQAISHLRNLIRLRKYYPMYHESKRYIVRSKLAPLAELEPTT